MGCHPATVQAGRSGELVQERSRCLQIGSVEAFREPGVDGRELRPGLVAPTGLRQEPREARRGAQLQRTLRAPASDLDGSAEAGLGLVALITAHEQLAVDAMNLRSVARVTLARRDGVERAECADDIADRGRGVGEEQPGLHPAVDSTVDRPLHHRVEGLLEMTLAPLPDSGAELVDEAVARGGGETVRLGNRVQSLAALPGVAPRAPSVLADRGKSEREGQRRRLCQTLCDAERLLDGEAVETSSLTAVARAVQSRRPCATGANPAA